MCTHLFPVIGLSSAFSTLAFGVAVPQYDHVVIVVEENHSYQQITSQFASSAPYINNTLKAQGASLTKMYGMEHPSQGNYLWMFSGSNQNIGFTNSDVGPFNTPNLGAGLIGAGYSFKGYSEDLPAIGSTVSISGAYARKHNPWVNFSNVPNGNTVATSSNLRFADFPTGSSGNFQSLPTVSIVVPNQDNDMHNGTDPQTIATGDAWIQSKIGAYYEWAKKHNSLLIVAWDESAGGNAALTNPAAGENQIATIFAGAGIAPGAYAEGNGTTLVNLLRTVEAMYGLAPSGAQSAPASAAGIGNGAITDIFQQWKTDANGNWNDTTKWVGGIVPNGTGATANLLSAIGSNRTITLTSGASITTLNIDNPNSYTINSTGNNSLTLHGEPDTSNTPPNRIRVASGHHTINAPVIHGSSSTIAQIVAGASLTLTNLNDGSGGFVKTGGGEMRVNRYGTNASLAVNGGTFTVLANGTNTSTSGLYLTGIANGGVLDLNDNDAALHINVGGGGSVPMSQVWQYLKAGYNNGARDGVNGISSSAARNDSVGNKTLGLLTGAEFTTNNGAADFSGMWFSSLDALIKYTYFGDVDFNGRLDASDYNLIDYGFVNHLTGWANGDADYSGAVDVSDYNLIDYAFTSQNGVVLRAMSYLEGYDRSTDGMSDPSLQIVIQHFEQFGEEYRTGFLSHVPEPASAISIFGLASGALLRRRRAIGAR